METLRQVHIRFLTVKFIDSGTFVQSRKAVVGGTSPVDSGTWSKGDIVWSSDPSTIGHVGWICTTAGTPGTWYPFGDLYLTGSITWDPASLVDGAGETSSAITITGAVLGDFIAVSAPYDMQGILASGYVSATNTARIRVQNETGGTIDLASGTWKVRVIKQ